MSNHDEHELLSGVNLDVTPLGDDELDDVAGGISKSKAADAKAAANADGRTFMLPTGNYRKLCNHNHKYKWARSKEREGTIKSYGDNYYDIKCYKEGCGKTWHKWYDGKGGFMC